ncbi:hypothetical protein EUX98_g2921 [Antrodiella citrinella]|uniref:Uncharacterized protein n=1 Tax=Antrodiella citrinella TaxID=2447956 RepID=A0A4S4N001_9APHY|nr:hypothetical protein EUX98_g2921 [Antrodiella citrinella]
MPDLSQQNLNDRNAPVSPTRNMSSRSQSHAPASAAVSATEEDWMIDLKEKTEGEISEKSRKDANKALESASKTTLAQSMKEIQNLVKEGNELSSRLFDVQHLTEKVNLPSKGEAKNVRDGCVDLLWNSRAIATTAKSGADDFRGDMLGIIMDPDTGMSNEEKMAELISWRETIGNKGAAATAQPGEFAKLRTRVKEYADRVEREIDDKESEAKARMDKLNAELEETTIEIDSLTVNVISPILKYLKLAGGAFAGVLSGSPSTALAALLTAVKEGVPELQQFSADLEATQKKRQSLEAKKTRIRGQIRALEGEQLTLGDASTIPTSLRDIADRIRDFSTRLTTFTNTFAQIFASTVAMIKEVLAVSSSILNVYASSSL